MIILNTTFYVETSLESEFLKWVRGSYIPGCPFSNPYLARILAEVEEGMSAFAVQVQAPTLAEAEAWHDGSAALSRDIILRAYPQRVLHFTTYMESLPVADD